ncbi:MAG: DUF1015 domain-containing protein [Rhodospirillaceae bacterium]|nr:DUF1015 domain-containing protein [Rhodospirillaceae bacterium]
MTTLVRPFRGLRPTPEAAANVAAPPYDVLNSAEAKAKAQGKPHSFLHISKPEIDLPDGTDVYSPAVYQKGADNFNALIKSGVLVRDDAPSYYVYRMRMGAHTQTGLAFVASVADYDTNRIRKHEFTRPDKEDDRVRQIEALNAQTGPVLLAYRKHAEVQNILMEAARAEPLYEVKGEYGVIHSVWRIDDPAAVERITTAFDAMDALYIADGHHRSAAASRVSAKKKTESASYFLAVAFPHDQMRILDYNRVIKDLNGLSIDDFLKKIRTKFIVTTHGQQYAPLSPTHFGMYLKGPDQKGQWYELVIQPDLVPAKDPVGQLDVSLLQNNLIAPILGIADPRRDKRIDFVGGIRGLTELEERVNSGDMAVAFALHATRMDQLMAVADAGEVMPPKSTWFEPKLADGLVSHVLD